MQRLNQYLFGYTSGYSLALIRIFVGSLSFFSWLAILPWMEDWYFESGFLPHAFIKKYAGDGNFNPLMWWPSDNLVRVVFALLLLSSLGVILGYRTRISCWIMFICTVVLHHRNPIILNSGDTLLRQAMFLLALSQCGAVWSLDQKRTGIEEIRVPVFPQRLIQVQLAVMYLTTVIHKLRGTMWLEGSAAWYPPRLTEFQRFPVPPFMDAPPFLQIGTWGTLIVEVALATLIFSKPYRKWVVLAGIALHLGIEYRFNIPWFAFICTSLYVSHYDGDEVKLAIANLSSKVAPKVTFVTKHFARNN